MKCPECGRELLSTGMCSNLMCNYMMKKEKTTLNYTYRTEKKKEELLLEEKDDIIQESEEQKKNDSKMFKKYPEDTDKIWDMTFKTLLLETPKLFLPLIKEVFGVDYSRDRRIVLLNNEYYSKEEGKVIADTIFSIGAVKYHF